MAWFTLKCRLSVCCSLFDVRHEGCQGSLDLFLDQTKVFKIWSKPFEYRIWLIHLDLSAQTACGGTTNWILGTALHSFVFNFLFFFLFFGAFIWNIGQPPLNCIMLIKKFQYVGEIHVFLRLINKKPYNSKTNLLVTTKEIYMLGFFSFHYLFMKHYNYKLPKMLTNKW